MQPLKDYLNESSLQHESILGPDQNKVLGRMTDDVIRSRIREYCTYDRQKYNRGELWSIVNEGLEITKIDKDNRGWYVETKSLSSPYVILYNDESKSLYDFFLSQRQQIDEQKGFLIEDLGIYFRWRKHNGELAVSFAPKFESTDGLPEELEQLHLYKCCQKSKKINVCNNIKIITIDEMSDLKISGNGCKNVIFPPNTTANVTVPSGVKIHHPKNWVEYNDLSQKLRS